MWSLLPSFCNYPLDTAESFKDLEKALCGSLRDEPDIRGVICSSLLILIQQNKKILEGNGDISGTETNNPRERALASYTPEVAAKNLNALRSSAREILSVLSGIFLKTSKDDGGLLQVHIIPKKCFLIHTRQQMRIKAIMHSVSIVINYLQILNVLYLITCV